MLLVLLFSFESHLFSARAKITAAALTYSTVLQYVEILRAAGEHEGCESLEEYHAESSTVLYFIIISSAKEMCRMHTKHCVT